MCYPWLRPYTSHKLDSKSKPFVFIGYSMSQSAYFCLDPTTNEVYTSRHVTFVEAVFPFAKSSSNVSTPLTESWFPSDKVSNETYESFPLSLSLSTPIVR